METTERLWSVTEAAWACGLTRCAIQKALDKHNITPVAFGHTQNGGYKYRESDIRRIYKSRFHTERVVPKSEVDACIICGNGKHTENFGVTHGLCLECWCRELNKFLIDMRMTYEDAEKATLEKLKQTGVIK